MGIGAPSLYAAFGSKAKLFVEATDLYLAEDVGEPTRLLAGGETARASVEAMLRSNADLFTRHRRARRLHADPGGVDVPRRRRPRSPSTSPPASSSASTTSRCGSNAARPTARTLPCLEVRALAEYFDAVVEGMAVRSMEGASRESLHRIVDITMRIWDVE